MQRRIKPRKRYKSIITQYDLSNQKLPSINTHNTQQGMSQKYSYRVNPQTSRTRSVPRQCRRHQYLSIFQGQEQGQQFECSIFRKQKSIGHKLQQRYKDLLTHRGGAIQRRGDCQSQEENIFHHSLLRGKKSKKFSAQTDENRQIDYQLPKRDKQLFSPVFFTRHYTHKEINSIRNGGQIRKQSIIRGGEIQQSYNRQLSRKKILVNFKKIGNVILFLQYLKRYSLKFRGRRRRYITKMMNSDSVNTKFIQLKIFFNNHFVPFYKAISENQALLHISQKDKKQMQSNKIQKLQSLMQILLGCISKGVEELKGLSLVQIIYSICKHGSFSCLSKVHSEEQLDILCISEKVGYIRADSYLERSSILTLVFIRIIVYSLLLQPSTLPNQEKKSLINIRLLSNILYQLIIDVQDRYLQLADQSMRIGNWRGISHFKFEWRESMAVKKGPIQKSELISGLLDHTFIREAYSINLMQDQKRIIEELVVKIHLIIKDYHRSIRKSCM